MKLGADSDQLTALGNTMKGETATIDALIAKINNSFFNTTWEGPAKDQFREDWEGTFKTALTNLKTALDAAGQDCVRRSQDLVLTMQRR